MTELITPPRAERAAPRALSRWSRAMVLRALQRIAHGELTLRDELGTSVCGQRDEFCDAAAVLDIHDLRFYSDIVLGGSLSAAEAYIAGFWRASDLTAAVRIMARNQEAMAAMEGGVAVLLAPLRWCAHWLRRNTRAGSRRNIVAHYDLGNDFFALFLDAEMMYSSAYYPTEQSTLEEAARAKLDRICRALRLHADDHVLEIGTGWGGFALHAAQHYGCRVTTTTISSAQHTHACARVAAAGLTGRVAVLKQDYRDLSGCFSKVVSIEMIEAVGHEYLPQYFATISRLLDPRGLALIQAIWIDDRRYDGARRHVDFIKRYIFPGSCIPSVHAMLSAAKRASDMRLVYLEDITAHYARTIREWRRRFWLHADELRARGYSEEFLRMWDYYFCYCEGGFLERVIGDAQLLFAKPLCKTDTISVETA